MSLFRHEVLENQRFRLHGDVMLSQSVSNWALTWLLLIIVSLLGAWITKGHYARTEQAVGRIVSDGPLARIVSSRPGVVTKMEVVEGQVVRAGQPLATIRVEQPSANRADPAGADLGSLDQQRTLLDQQISLARETQAGEAAKLSSSVAQYETQIATLSREIDLQGRVVESARSSFEPLTEAMTKGIVSKIQYEQRRQAYLGQQEQLAQMQAQQAELKGELRQAQVAYGQLPTQTASKVADLQTSQAALTQKRIEVENSSSYVITAPVAGRVSALQITLGATVNEAFPLMTIVGEGSRMEAELYAPSRAIGFARKGQEVRLMYDAFPYQRFGSFSGHIINMSRTVLAPNEIDAPIPTKEPVYRMRVALDNQTISGFGERAALQPGMTLTANIVLDRRTFFDWLIEPINAVKNRT